jgi:ABC-type phosphate transport system permease subunit
MDAIQQIVTKIEVAIVNPLIYLISFVAVVIFLWGLFVFIRNAEDSTERSAGIQHMIWGTVGLAIMFSVYGILNVIISLWK